VLWGAYHGVLVVAGRWFGGAAAGRPRRLWVDLPHVVFTFALVSVGWLIFRETDMAMLVRDLSLRPWNTTLADRQVGAYLFLLAAIYSVPVWLEGLWAVYIRPRLGVDRPSPEIADWTTVGQTVLAGVALAVILVLRSQQSLDFIYFQF
jgi:hypothetical protein